MITQQIEIAAIEVDVLPLKVYDRRELFLKQRAAATSSIGETAFNSDDSFRCSFVRSVGHRTVRIMHPNALVSGTATGLDSEIAIRASRRYSFLTLPGSPGLSSIAPE